MCRLKGFSRLKMCFSDVQDGLILESLAFVYDCVQKDSFSVRDFSSKFDCRVMSLLF